jgi:hypothetical protein
MGRRSASTSRTRRIGFLRSASQHMKRLMVMT